MGPAGERLSINPDAFFGMTDADRPVDRNTDYFFLEVERSRQHGYKNGESALVRKVQAYEAYARQGRHRESWGIDGFRVLVVVPTIERATNLRVTMSRADVAAS
jgi:hypothetical protein